MSSRGHLPVPGHGGMALMPSLPGGTPPSLFQPEKREKRRDKLIKQRVTKIWCSQCHVFLLNKWWKWDSKLCRTTPGVIWTCKGKIISYTTPWLWMLGSCGYNQYFTLDMKADLQACGQWRPGWTPRLCGGRLFSQLYTMLAEAVMVAGSRPVPPKNL